MTVQTNSPNPPYLHYRYILYVILFIICANIFLYNISENHKFPKEQRRTLTSGFSHDKARHFIFFYYYKNLFPVGTSERINNYSAEEADRILNTKGNTLFTEKEHWTRLGENARILMYLPNAILKGSPENPSTKLFNSIFFTIALIVFFLGFSLSGMRIFATVLVVIVIATPFFWFEIYENNNVFGLMTVLFLIIMGLNIKILIKQIPIYKVIVISIFSGVLIAFFSEIRGELAIVTVSLLILYVFTEHYKIVYKSLFVILLFTSFIVSRNLVVNYFNSKFDKANEIVLNKGGNPYIYPRTQGHIIWHPIFCGLGDFDKKYGYEWNDKVAYKYALPILKEKYNIHVNYSDQYYTDDYYDPQKMYYIKFDEIPVYEQIMKDKVVSDIKSDPGWYISILLKRVVRILSVTLPVPFAGWLIFPLVFVLFRRKEKVFLKMILISLPLSLTPLLIFSGGNATFNSFFPYILISILVLDTILFLKKKDSNKIELQK